MRFAWLMLVVLIIGGCPARPEQNREKPDVTPSLAYPEFANALTDEDGFRDELKRLQELYTSSAGLGHAGTGTANSKYKLRSRIEDGRAGLELHTNEETDNWVLWLWQDSELTADDITVVEDGHTAGGYRLEFSIRESVLTINVNARWLQGRYLQISRELILGGIDHTIAAPVGSVTWELEGEWLPYRMIPGGHGPYGVVPDGEADGEWHGSIYPETCMVPSIAAYDRDRGFMLTVVDEHPRRLDRSYLIDYGIPLGYEGGSLARIRYQTYDPTVDAYQRPLLFSGLPIRDSVVLEPFTLGDRSTDPTLVYAETDEVIKLLGQVVRSFHFDADPPERAIPGGFVTAAGWVDAEEDIPEFLRKASGIWDVRYSDARLYDAALEAGANVGIGASEIDGGAGLAPEVLETLQAFQPEVMKVVAALDFLTLSSSRAYADIHPEWLVETTVDDPLDLSGVLELRNPEASDWLVDKMASDLAAYPNVAGYAFEPFPGYAVVSQRNTGNGYPMSWDAAAAAVVLKTAEAVQWSREDSLIVTEGPLNLAIPEFGNIHLYDEDYYTSDTTYEVDHSRRFAPTVLWEVFSGATCIGYGDSPALQVIASSRTTYGHQIQNCYRDLPGFREYAESQRELREAAGDVQFLYCNPLQAVYTMGSERPAVCDQIVAILPADWEEDTMFWVAFHGTGGSVEIDEKNTLTVTWDTGGRTERKLPTGYWVTDHPDPANVQNGDVVVIERRQVAMPNNRGGATL